MAAVDDEPTGRVDAIERAICAEYVEDGAAATSCEHPLCCEHGEEWGR